MCQAQPRQLRARIIHPHHAPRRIQHRHQRGNRVQRRGNKAALDGQRALRALPLPLRLLLQPDAVVQLQPRHCLAAQNLQQRQMFRLELVWLARQHRQRADHLLVAADQRHCRIREAGIGARQRDALGRKAADPCSASAISSGSPFSSIHWHAVLARGCSVALKPEPRLEPQPVEIHPADVGVVGVAQYRGELGELVQRRIRVAVEDSHLRARTASWFSSLCEPTKAHI